MPKVSSFSEVTSIDNDHNLYVVKSAVGSDARITYANLASQLSAGLITTLYNDEETHDISASSVAWDLDGFYAEDDGYVASWAWSGGDGTYQATWFGGSGKTIGGVSAVALITDLVGDGQGRLTLRKEGNNARILYYKDEYDETTGGTTFTATKTDTGRLYQNGAIEDLSGSQGDVYDFFSPYIPNVGEVVAISGGLFFGTRSGWIKRTDATTLTYYYEGTSTTASGSYTMRSDGSGNLSYSGNSTFAWQTLNTRWTTAKPVIG